MRFISLQILINIIYKTIVNWKNLQTALSSCILCFQVLIFFTRLWFFFFCSAICIALFSSPSSCMHYFVIHWWKMFDRLNYINELVKLINLLLRNFSMKFLKKKVLKNNQQNFNTSFDYVFHKLNWSHIFVSQPIRQIYNFPFQH